MSGRCYIGVIKVSDGCQEFLRKESYVLEKVSDGLGTASDGFR